MFVREKETKTGLLIDKALLSMAGSIGGAVFTCQGISQQEFRLLVYSLS